MKLSIWTTGILVVAWISSSPATAQPRDRAEVALRAALEKETVEGNLKAAIEEYKKLAENANKSVAARALVRLGECYEKQGDADARKTYEQVLSKFGDQTAAVAEARARLAALGIPGQAGQLSTKLVWGSPKSDGDSISPDGRYLSYTDSVTGNLLLHDLVTGEDRALTTAGNMKVGEEAYVQRSAISRDGRQIAYAWWDVKTKIYALYVANLSGDPNPRRLGNAPVVPAEWSPDGKWIAARAIQKDGIQSPWRLALINTQDGSVRTLKSGSEQMLGFGFSPDGKYILYSLPAGNNERFRILSLDGKSDVALVPEPYPVPGPSSIRSPVWTPDGSRIVFGSPRPAPSMGLWFIRVVDGKPAGPPERLKGEFGDPFPIGFTRDGSLFYSSNNGRLDIYVAGLDPASGKLTSASKHVNDRTPGQSWGRLAWLPDSKSVSYWSRRMGRDALVVHTLATGTEQELWSVDNYADGPGYIGWFADGSILRSEKSDEKLLMRRVDSRTLEARASWTIPNFSILKRNREIAFPRDLSAIFFARRDESVRCEGASCTHVLIARDFETGRDREVLRLEAASITDPSVSPDGRNVAFVATVGAESALLVAPTGGGAPRELFRGLGMFRGTAWTQDGARVLVMNAHSGGELWSFQAIGGAPEKSALHLPIIGGVVSPDGAQIAFTTWDSGSGIWAMTGLFPATSPKPAR